MTSKTNDPVKLMQQSTSALEKIVEERFALVEALRAKNIEMVSAMRQHDLAAERSGLPPRDRVAALTIFYDHAALVGRAHKGGLQEVRFDRLLSDFAKTNPFERKRERAVSEGRFGESRLTRGMAFAAIKARGAN